MLIISWSSSGSLSGIADVTVFRSVLSIFITAALLNFIKVTLDICLTIQAWGNMEWTQIIRYLLKFFVAIAWIIILPVTYSSSIKNPSGAGKLLNSWTRNWYNQSVYNVAIVIYMGPNILAALLFLLPQLQNVMERSNSRAFILLMWWIQPRLYVARGMHENILSIFKYVFFWVVLLTCKLAFSFYVECHTTSVLSLLYGHQLFWCTLWTHKYGMLFSPPSLGAFQVPSVMLVRYVP